MPSIKHEYFRKGMTNQKSADIVVSLKRRDTDEMQKWTAEEKEHLKDFIERSEKTFQAFKEEILSIL